MDEIKEGEEALLLLDKTPFYAEMGGQVGDSGTIAKAGHSFHVYDCTSPFPGVIAHLGKMGSGSLRKGDHVHASIDLKKRGEIQNNHTATHLLHWALQQVLGPHIKQAGSLVDEKRLRFDFSHHKSVSPQEIRAIEDLVNEKIRTDLPVQIYELSYDEAQKRSDIKQFFGEKYGDRVRVIDIEFSKELCGGTHTSRVGTIGLFKVSKESSIAAGVRRIEALTGRFAEIYVQQEEDLLIESAALLKTTSPLLVEKIGQLLEENKTLTSELKTIRKGQIKQIIENCFASREMAGSISLIAAEISVPVDELNSCAEELIGQLKSGVVVLGVKMGERCQVAIAVSPDLISKNINAQALIKEIAPLIQGGGGGKQNLAQAGGKDPGGIGKALSKVRHLLEELSVV